VIVVDASALLEVLLHTPAAAAVEARLFDAGETLHAPHLIDVEVAQALRRYALAGKIDPAHGCAALEIVADLPLRRYPHAMLLARIWQLRGSLTAYDAAYVALAEALDAPLVTRDHRLADAAGRQARIEFI
jgi:predicted nucleic acid-binding protein